MTRVQPLSPLLQNTDLEAERRAALARYGILDTEAEQEFDDIVEVAAEICGTPVSLVSLLDSDRQWFKAELGFGHAQTPMSQSICRYTANMDHVLVVPDATRDPRTAGNTLVTGEPHVRFYAGAPLVTPEGVHIGALCVLDTRPRAFTDRQAAALQALARQVMSLLALRRTLREREGLLQTSRRTEAHLAAIQGELTANQIRQDALLQLGDALRDAGTVEAMTRAASEIVGTTLGGTRAGFATIDETGEYADIQPDWTAPGIASIAGRHRFEDYGDISSHLQRGEPLVIEDVATDPRTAADPTPMLSVGIISLVNMPVRERGRTVALFLVHDDRPRSWPPEALAFLRNVADRVEAGVARLRAEAEQQVLNGEITHRLKNTLSMVQGIARQTLKNLADRSALDAFERRVSALASAHDILLRRGWNTASMHAVTRKVLGAVAPLDRFDLSGPTIDFGPKATLSASLVLHEMATNALKYGALSTEAGRVGITWRVVDGTAGKAFELDWIESGGPPAVEPSRRGFGSRLIRAGLIGAGGTEVRYLPEGYQAHMTASLDDVRQA